MKIELCEDNGFMNENGPTMIVLVVTQDDGQKIRVPYSTSKSIKQLYKDLRKSLVKTPSKSSFDMNIIDNQDALAEQPKKRRQKNNDQIQREDIVSCIKVNERDSGMDKDLIPIKGNEYRVINVIKKNRQIINYELLDDLSDNKIRIPVFPDEVRIEKKHVPGPPRVMKPSVIVKCACGEDNALYQNESGEKYVGSCESCEEKLEQPRMKPATV